jgi:hypothetical protein
MKSLILVAGLLFGSFNFIGSAAPVAQAVPSSATNPYCGKQPSDFSVPEVVCPSDGYYIVDVDCVAACDDAYRSKMVEIYNAACVSYDNADANYKLCTRLAIHAYDACFAAATTLPEREACRDTLTTAMEDCAATRAATRAAIAANVASQSAAAAATFQECAAKCCKKVGELGGKSNGGKIGAQGSRSGN